MKTEKLIFNVGFVRWSLPDDEAGRKRMAELTRGAK